MASAAYVVRRPYEPAGRAVVIPGNALRRFKGLGCQMMRQATEEEAAHVATRPVPLTLIREKIAKAKAEAEQAKAQKPAPKKRGRPRKRAQGDGSNRSE